MYGCSWPWGCFQKRVLKSGHQLRTTNSISYESNCIFQQFYVCPTRSSSSINIYSVLNSLAYKHIHKNIQIVSDVTLNTHQQLLPKPMPNHPSETHAANVYTLASYAMLCKTRVGPNIHTTIQSVVVDKWSWATYSFSPWRVLSLLARAKFVVRGEGDTRSKVSIVKS